MIIRWAYKAQKQQYDKRAMDDKYLDLVFGLGEKVFADEEGNATQKAVVAHDIRLARINANGSYDVDFPESIGGGSSMLRYGTECHHLQFAPQGRHQRRIR